MNKYKPEYLGKVVPNESAKITEFVMDKFDSFSKIYDACKDQSESISDIKAVDVGSTDPSSLSVKLSTGSDTLSKITESIKNDTTITMSGDVITAKNN